MKLISNWNFDVFFKFFLCSGKKARKVYEFLCCSTFTVLRLCQTIELFVTLLLGIRLIYTTFAKRQV